MKDDLTLVSADALSRSRLVDLFNAGYEGYAVPVQVDTATLAFMVDALDVDLRRSRVAVRAEEPIGLALLGVRGRAGWVGGMGVVQAERRAGLGRRLMEAIIDEARAAGVEELGLEVLEPNLPAIRLYEQLGFRRTRLLEVWSLDSAPPPSAASTVELARAWGWIRENRRAAEPWQRADETIARLLGLGQDPEGLGLVGRGAALFRVASGRVSVLQLAAADDGAAEELLAAARGRGETLRFVNVPVGDPSSAAMSRLGGRLDVRQLELALPIAATA